MTDPARLAALRLMTDVTSGGALLSHALPERIAALDPSGRARAQRLATGALRWADRSDRALGPHLRLKPREGTLNALRLALYEMFEGGAPAHAAVNAAVSLVRADRETAGQAGLVNAVLRNVARKGPEGWAALPLPRLPKWLRKPLVSAHGKPRVAAMEAVFAAAPPVDLTVRGDAGDWAARLGGTVTPTGSVRLAEAGQISTLPGYADGAWWVQDAAAALPARALGDVAGLRVLDLCAAPGGKTLQLAAAGAMVTALDSSETRMARVAENLARCGLTAKTVVADARRYEAGPFDAVLLDAPCSATGTIRRHPDLPHAKRGADFSDLVALQADLIDRALSLVRPGGRVVYCTCSLLPEEGEVQLAAALSRHPDLATVPEALALPGVAPDWLGDTGLRLFPDFWADRGGMDGFFIASLRRG